MQGIRCRKGSRQNIQTQGLKENTHFYYLENVNKSFTWSIISSGRGPAQRDATCMYTLYNVRATAADHRENKDDETLTS